jgi:hypothetical protein
MQRFLVVWQVHQTLLQSNSAPSSATNILLDSLSISNFPVHLTSISPPQKSSPKSISHHNSSSPPPIYNPIFLAILPSLSHPSVATRPRSSVKTAQYNAAAHFCQQPILYHPRAMSQHVCSRIGSIARWLLQCIRCYRWGCLEYGNGAREF